MESVSGRNPIYGKHAGLGGILMQIGFPIHSSSDCKALSLLTKALGVGRVEEKVVDDRPVVRIEWLSGKVLHPALSYDRRTTIGDLLKIIAPLALGPSGDTYGMPYLCTEKKGSECSSYSRVESFVETDVDNTSKPLKLFIITKPFQDGRLDHDPLLEVLNHKLTETQLERVVEINRQRIERGSSNKLDFRNIVKKYAEIKNYKQAVECVLMEKAANKRTNGLETILSQITKSTSIHLSSLWEIVDNETKPLDKSKQLLHILKKHRELHADINSVSEVKNRIDSLFFFKEEALELYKKCLP